MLISDWSADVCSSDLASMMPEAAAANRSVFYAADGSMRSLAEIRERFRVKLEAGGKIENMKPLAPARWHAQASSSSGLAGAAEIGRASCRERVCQYV